MKLVTFSKEDRIAIDTLQGDKIVYLTAAGLGAPMQQFIEGGNQGFGQGTRCCRL